MSKPRKDFDGYTVEDTAAWIAYFRARESDRKDALFIDPCAQLLLAKSGLEEQISADFGRPQSAVISVRTKLLDNLLLSYIEKHKIEVVINLGAGYDTRPYRLSLPKKLEWIEVDFPDIIAMKEVVLVQERPSCVLRRQACDLSDDGARRELFAVLNKNKKRTLILTEALLLFLSQDQVVRLAQDLAGCLSFQYWLLEYCSQEFVDRTAQPIAQIMKHKKAVFTFGVPNKNQAGFFLPFWWHTVEHKNVLPKAHELERKRGYPLSYPDSSITMLGVSMMKKAERIDETA